MDNSKLKEQLGDDLCDYCPWRAGEIDHTSDSLCEGIIAMMLLKHSWMKIKAFF